MNNEDNTKPQYDQPQHNSKGHFLPGNSIGKLTAGVPRPNAQKKQHKLFMRDYLDNYSPEDITKLMDDIVEPEKKLFFLIKMLELDNKRIDAETRRDFDQLRIELQHGLGEEVNNDIEVEYIDFDKKEEDEE
jgi:hypothetical protein